MTDEQIRIKFLEAMCLKLFVALNDEVLWCIDNNYEVSELSIQALKRAQETKIGESDALIRYNDKFMIGEV